MGDVVVLKENGLRAFITEFNNEDDDEGEETCNVRYELDKSTEECIKLTSIKLCSIGNGGVTRSGNNRNASIAPHGTMVQNRLEDQVFTISEVEDMNHRSQQHTNIEQVQDQQQHQQRHEHDEQLQQQQDEPIEQRQQSLPTHAPDLPPIQDNELADQQEQPQIRIYANDVVQRHSRRFESIKTAIASSYQTLLKRNTEPIQLFNILKDGQNRDKGWMRSCIPNFDGVFADKKKVHI